MNYWRLVLSKYSDPYTNMAIDEAILRAYIAGTAPPTLRIYGWKPEAISLGYFQKAEEVLDIAQCAELNVLFVRRLTGGEAIFHSNELTYSISCSETVLELPESVKESFKVLTSFLVNAYKKLGLKAYFFSEDKNKSKDRRQGYSFCFAASQDFDIAIAGKKIGGNAQKRMKRIIFQQGSIPLTLDIDRIRLFFREDLSGIKDRVTSLESILGETLEFEQFQSIIVNAFKKTFGVRLVEGTLTPFELELSKALKKEKYDSREWNYSNRVLKEASLAQ